MSRKPCEGPKTLTLAAVVVDQACRRAGWQAKGRQISERVAIFHGGADDAGRNRSRAGELTYDANS
jgi:hypothetical protein